MVAVGDQSVRLPAAVRSRLGPGLAPASSMGADTQRIRLGPTHAI